MQRYFKYLGGCAGGERKHDAEEFLLQVVLGSSNSCRRSGLSAPAFQHQPLQREHMALGKAPGKAPPGP